MKYLTAVVCYLLLFPAGLSAQGSSIGTAVSISLNGSASATISDASRDHYWKITTLANGYLRVEVNSASTLDLDVRLYDVNGSTVIMSDGRSGTYSEVFGFLKPGTYFVYVYRWSGTTGSYTIGNAFTSPSRAADAEPNDTPASAASLSPNGTATGHLGFYGDGSSDTKDYWKIALAQNAWLRVQVRSDSLDLRGDVTLDFDVRMYDSDGTTVLRSDGRSGTFSEVSFFLGPGAYYVEVYRWLGRAGSYEIKSEYFPPPLGTDPEPNDTYQTATTAPINGTITGHIGYRTDGATDTQDYWKFTVPSNGTVSVRVVSDSLDRSGVEFELDLEVYDVNGTTVIKSDGGYGPFSECIVHLRPGTFFARVYRWSGNAGSYALTVTHTPPALPNDVEGNDTYTTATSLMYGVLSSGHIGFYAGGTTDTEDYWKLTAPSDDSIYVHVSSDPSLDLDLEAYAPNGTSVIASDGRSGIYSRVGIKPTAGSIYYFRVYRWWGTAGAYSIIAQRSAIPTSVESAAAQNFLPEDFVLEQNFPNPFNPSTTIRYGLPRSNHVRIAVYSLLGQELNVLSEGLQTAGYHQIVWDGKTSTGDEVSSGIYLVRMKWEDGQALRKVMLVR